MTDAYLFGESEDQDVVRRRPEDQGSVDDGRRCPDQGLLRHPALHSVWDDQERRLVSRFDVSMGHRAAWTADAGSTVVSDGVTAQGTKSDAVVTSQVTVRNRATGGNECAMRILVGGVVVKTDRS